MSTAIPPHLLPDTAEVDGAGRLAIGGVDLLELAEEYGTPLSVYDEHHLRNRCREAVAAFGEGVAYAATAFLCRSMARLVQAEGMHVDVFTGGELEVAIAAGVSPSRLVLHGNNKSVAELRRGRELGVRLVVDSFDELGRLERLHGEDGRSPQVLVRVAPGFEASGYQATIGSLESKFGFSLSSGAADRAVEWAAGSRAVQLIGLHAHFGSQILAMRSFQTGVQMLSSLVEPLGLPELCLGGGLGVACRAGDEVPSITEWAAVLHHACWAAGITARVTAEPGRAIVGAAGLTLYRVGTIKVGSKVTFVAVDGGLSDNPRPALEGSAREVFLPRATDAERPSVYNVVGRHCEGDLLAPEARMPAGVTVGDIVCMPVTGAYCHAMASNYHKVPRPAVVFIGDGRTRLVVRRETIEDLLRLDDDAKV